MGAVGIPPPLRDFQAERESPALGLFRAAAASTALFTHRFCYRAYKVCILAKMKLKGLRLFFLLVGSILALGTQARSQNRDAGTSFKRLIIRAVLRHVSPMVFRQIAVSDHLDVSEFNEIFCAVLGWSERAPRSRGRAD